MLALTALNNLAAVPDHLPAFSRVRYSPASLFSPSDVLHCSGLDAGLYMSGSHLLCDLQDIILAACLARASCLGNNMGVHMHLGGRHAQEPHARRDKILCPCSCTASPGVHDVTPAYTASKDALLMLARLCWCNSVI